ncbi:ER-derived vesicles protein erv14 [Schizosaccharomyces pombe]|uniref:ER-derived vesicles protein erv14 n=1 Tax=Schizosaccharomyces pombe (strain 972 / ATCC 24843) TaxID=284812 RepID=ERV14_SCHPO|nr:putative cornichon family protein Erv14 [Schizosaccharomyces pombe]Q9P6K6.2 RecName: Full=ER-derived vesicles protein erv14 [Schizosaccharomyces pombe 972h-]CAB90792.2 cornichon family protein Erv14 (predicted) [Schizosaccharomyces pombe]|eukprot:NP_594657.2 putative cornichon family protein Erv14 [Schizosaccharomyces pombe]
MMSFGSFVYIACLLLNGANMLLQIFCVIMFSDLEMDYINPIDLCNKLNDLVMPEIISHTLVTLLLLLGKKWLLFLANLPLLVFHANQVIHKTHILDATEIFRQLGRHKRDNFIKVTFYLIMFFTLLYCMVMSLIQEE